MPVRLLPALFIAVAAAVGLGAYAAWQLDERENAPTGLSRANGRIEATRVAVATKYAGRIAEVLAKEGEFVEAGAVVARMDTAELLAEIAAAKARARQAERAVGQAKAAVLMRQAELKLGTVELERAKTLQKRDFVSASTVDQRQAERDVAAAAVTAALASVGDAEAAVTRLLAVLHDQTLRAPVSGRVEYELAQPGEVLAAGGQIVTLLDLSDVYMTIFLAAPMAGRVGLGTEARIVLDAAPDYVVPASVSFVAAEAQFTPKFVETENEREKLMYRIKLQIDPALLRTYRDYVKAGLTGDAYVKVDSAAAWPATLAPKLPALGEAK